jgi:hypothetical protein
MMNTIPPLIDKIITHRNDTGSISEKTKHLLQNSTFQPLLQGPQQSLVLS